MTWCPVCRGRGDDPCCPCGGTGQVEVAMMDNHRPNRHDVAWLSAVIGLGLAIWVGLVLLLVSC